MPSGTTHNSGIGTTSLVMYVVTLNIKLHGTNASSTHRTRRPTANSSTGAFARARGDSSSVTGFRAKRQTHAPQAAVNTTSTAYPIAHHRLCWLNLRWGSINTG